MVVDRIKRKPHYVSGRKRLSVETDNTISSLIITLTIIIVILSGSYLFLKSRSSQQAYLLSQIQDEHTRLQNTNEGLNAKLVEALSFNKIEDAEQIKIMSEPESKTYITPPTKKKK